MGIAPSPPLPVELEHGLRSPRYQSKLANLQSQSDLSPEKKTGFGLLSLLNKMTHSKPDLKQFPTRSNSPQSPSKKSPRRKLSNAQNPSRGPMNFGLAVRPKPVKLPQITLESSILFQSGSPTEHPIFGGGGLTAGKYFMGGKRLGKGLPGKTENSSLSKPELSCLNNQSMTLSQSALKPRQTVQGGGLKVLKKNVTKKKNPSFDRKGKKCEPIEK